MRISLLNHLGKKYDRECALIGDVCGKYAAVVALAWELPPVSVSFTPGMMEAPDGFVPMGLFENPTIAGAMGFHDRDSKGRSYGSAFLSTVPNEEMLHDASGAGQSMCGVVTHEIAELIGDPLANLWAQIPVFDSETGKTYSLACYEWCDWVQNYSFLLKSVDGTVLDCSDFVWPEFFNPDAQKGAQLSQMRSPTEPGQVTPGGYGIVSNEESEGQVFARVKGLFRPAKHLPRRIFHSSVKPPEWRENMFQTKKHSRTKHRLGS
jgi:hypothetical protein